MNNNCIIYVFIAYKILAVASKKNSPVIDEKH